MAIMISIVYFNQTYMNNTSTRIDATRIKILEWLNTEVPLKNILSQIGS